VSNVAKWNGSAWSALGVGGDGDPTHLVRALEVYDEGAGPRLHAAGSFFGGAAVWHNGNWSILRSGIVSSVPFQTVPVYSLRAFDDGGGSALFAGGEFTIAGGLSVNNIARWRAGEWQPLGTRHGLAGNVAAMSIFDNGSGPELVVGGNF